MEIYSFVFKEMGAYHRNKQRSKVVSNIFKNSLYKFVNFDLDSVTKIPFLGENENGMSSVLKQYFKICKSILAVILHKCGQLIVYLKVGI